MLVIVIYYFHCVNRYAILDVCYNVHTVVDSKHHLIVDFELTNCSSDAGNLLHLSTKAKEVMAVETLTNLADKGYYDSEDIAACERNGVTCLVAKRKTGGVKKAKGFTRDDFVYEHENNCYRCPSGAILRYMRDKKKNDGKAYWVYSNTTACSKCPLKPECTTYSYRAVERLVNQDALDRVEELMKKNKALYHKRKEIVEHPFGTIKAVWGYKHFLCRTKPKVIAETALAYLAYNLRRVANIFMENREAQVAVL